jgi:DNA-binding NtrC family response regulator
MANVIKKKLMAVYPDLKIFIVDDDIFCLTLYNQFLKNLGYSNVTSFTGGGECLDHLNASPELIFLDYNMEGLNGIEVLQKIKAENPNVAVYIITGKEDANVAREAEKHGAVDYIVKSSLSPDKMKSIMERVEELQAGKPREPKKAKGFFSRVFGN